MAQEPSSQLSPSCLAKRGARQRRRREYRTPSRLGGRHLTHAAGQQHAVGRHLGRGQPAMARNRGPAYPACAVRRHARGWAVASRRAGDGRGVPERAPRPAGPAHGGDRRQGRRRQVGRCQDQGRRTEDHAPHTKAITPEEAEAAAERLYAMAPSARITSVLADVHSWTAIRERFHPSTHRNAG